VKIGDKETVIGSTFLVTFSHRFEGHMVAQAVPCIERRRRRFKGFLLDRSFSMVSACKNFHVDFSKNLHPRSIMIDLGQEINFTSSVEFQMKTDIMMR
jgi:hypothetical protein